MTPRFSNGRACNAGITTAKAGISRAIAAEAGGSATLFRGAMGEEEVFAPLPPPVLRLHRSLKQVFDPAGILNPGRMYAGL